MTGTFSGSLTFDNVAGTLSGVTFSRDGGLFPGTADCSATPTNFCNTGNLSGGGFVLVFLSANVQDRFFVNEGSLVGIQTLTPFQAGNPVIAGTFLTNDASDSICGGHTCDIASMTYTPRVPGVPEPASVLLLATGIMAIRTRLRSA